MNVVLLSAQWVFWVCLFLVFYSYFLYPILLFVAYSLSQIRRDCRYLTSRRKSTHAIA